MSGLMNYYIQIGDKYIFQLVLINILFYGHNISFSMIGLYIGNYYILSIGNIYIYISILTICLSLHYSTIKQKEQKISKGITSSCHINKNINYMPLCPITMLFSIIYGHFFFQSVIYYDNFFTNKDKTQLYTKKKDKKKYQKMKKYLNMPCDTSKCT